MSVREAYTRIMRAYTRTYSDTGQTIAYVEWSDGSRTQGPASHPHMAALLARAERDGRYEKDSIHDL